MIAAKSSNGTTTTSVAMSTHRPIDGRWIRCQRPTSSSSSITSDILERVFQHDWKPAADAIQARG